MKFSPFAIVLLAACARPQVALLDPTVQYAPRCGEGVAVYVDPSKVPGDAKEIAIFTGQGRSQSDMDAMKAAAGKIGATGLALGQARGQSVRGTSNGTTQDATALFSPSDSSRASGVCSTLAAQRRADADRSSVTLNKSQLDSLRSMRGWTVSLQDPSSTLLGTGPAIIATVGAESMEVDLSNRQRIAIALASVSGFNAFPDKRAVTLSLKK
jgi:hypothetical protein